MFIVPTLGKEPMTANAILDELVRIRPDFRRYWDGENYFRDDDGSFTACGVFSQFTGFFREQHQRMTREDLQAVAALVGRCASDDFLSESVYTCFLENIAGEPPDETLASYLSPAAIEFMSHWKHQK